MPARKNSTASDADKKRGKLGRPEKAELEPQIKQLLEEMRRDLSTAISLREVARRLNVSPQTIYNHELEGLVTKAIKPHKDAMKRLAPRRHRRDLAEQVEHIMRERDEWRTQYENLLRQWQIVEYNLRERHDIDPAALYRAAIPEAKRDVARIGRSNPRLRPGEPRTRRP